MPCFLGGFGSKQFLAIRVCRWRQSGAIIGELEARAEGAGGEALLLPVVTENRDLPERLRAGLSCLPLGAVFVGGLLHLESLHFFFGGRGGGGRGA